MLRSIFRLIDTSEKNYNNTKPQALIYCFTNSDETVDMDLNVKGIKQRIVKGIQERQAKYIEATKKKSFSLETKNGDVKCVHTGPVSIVPKTNAPSSSRVTFTKSEEVSIAKNKKSEDREAKVRTLIENFPKKRVEIPPKDKDQISLLLEQIRKMKSGLERLQEITHQFNSSERLCEDVNYLVNNVRPHLKTSPKENEADQTRNVPSKV